MNGLSVAEFHVIPRYFLSIEKSETILSLSPATTTTTGNVILLLTHFIVNIPVILPLFDSWSMNDA
jgi:hypothetical protein